MSDDTLRAALLRIFDMAEDRPDIRGVARAALAASATDERPCTGCAHPRHHGSCASPAYGGATYLCTCDADIRTQGGHHDAE